jgi:hypothetical protein
MASIRHSAASLATSATPTMIAALSELEDQHQQEDGVKDGNRDVDVTLDKARLTPSPIPENEPELNVVTWDGPDDPTNPRNWSVKYRWFVTVLISINNLASCV